MEEQHTFETNELGKQAQVHHILGLQSDREVKMVRSKLQAMRIHLLCLALTVSRVLALSDIASPSRWRPPFVQRPLQNPKTARAARPDANASPMRPTIRRSTLEDLPAVAKVLAAAATANSHARQSALPFTNWKVQMDTLWAAKDIEALLLRRCKAGLVGRTAARALDRALAHSPPHGSDTDSYMESVSSASFPHDRLRLLWQRAPQLSQEIAACASETGEDTVWRHHDTMALPPPCPSWLVHVQLTAAVTTTRESRSTSSNQQQGKHDAVAGFCEVAMLGVASAPLSSGPGAKDGESIVPTTPILDGQYAPAICNLAVSPQYRRQGVARRLLASAERYVALQLNATTTLESAPKEIGLYVECDNDAAVSLYTHCGYVQQTKCSGGDMHGSMWYMTKPIGSVTSTFSSHDETKVSENSLQYAS